MLAAAGRLDERVGGPPFRPAIQPEAIATRSKDPYPGDLDDGPERWRRSLYGFVKRSVPEPIAEAFDAPDRIATCGRRNRTTVPTQALTLLNDPFVRSCAEGFAERVTREAGSDPGCRVDRAFAIAIGRPPRRSEREAAVGLLAGGGSLVDLCHVLFTLNEFIYID